METTTHFDIQFSAWREVQTKYGPRRVRSGAPTESFWSAWRSDSGGLKSAGYAVGRDQRGEWQVSQWAKLDAEETARRARAIEESRATDANVEIPVPDGLSYLGYQRAGIRYATNKPAVLIADEMGLGKTIQALGVINADPLIENVIIVCPASLRLNWKREAEKWLVRPFRIGVVEGKNWPKGDPNLIIINYDVLTKHRERLSGRIFDAAIFDEAHYMKSQDAQRTQVGLSIGATQTIFLTGTPILNRPVELFPMLTRLDPADLGANFFRFGKRYCAAKKNRFGWDFKGASNLEELQTKLRERCMIRRKKAEVLKELPPKRRQIIELPVNGCGSLIAEEKSLFDLRDERLAELRFAVEMAKASEDEAVYRAALAALRGEVFLTLGEMAKTRKMIALAKVPYVISHLEDCLESGPVICFAHHKDVIARIAEAFGDGVAIITGDTSMTERQRAVDDFQSGRKNLFLGNMQAAGVGITLTRSSHVVFAEMDWVPAILAQAEDRAHRIGQTNSVLVQHLIFSDSMDAVLARSVVRKQEVIDKALDDEIPEPEEFVVEPRRERAATENTTRKQIVKQAESMTEERNLAIHEGLRILAGMCDGAREEDGHGFNKLDTRIGKELASLPALTARQAVLGAKVLRKYVRQIPEQIYSRAIE